MFGCLCVSVEWYRVCNCKKFTILYSFWLHSFSILNSILYFSILFYVNTIHIIKLVNCFVLLYFHHSYNISNCILIISNPCFIILNPFIHMIWCRFQCVCLYLLANNSFHLWIYASLTDWGLVFFLLSKVNDIKWIKRYKTN